MNEERGKNGKSRNGHPKWRANAADLRVQRVVVREVRSGQRSAPEIERILLDEVGISPSKRTIQKMVKWADDMDTEPWTLAAADRDDIALIAPIWHIAIEDSSGLSKGQAEWIVRVCLAAPDLPPEDVWDIAELYELFSNFVEELRDEFLCTLDALLAFSPWRDVEHAERYFSAANEGWIDSPHPHHYRLAMRAGWESDLNDMPSFHAWVLAQPDRDLIAQRSLDGSPHSGWRLALQDELGLGGRDE